MQCGGTSSNTPGGIVRSAINIWQGQPIRLIEQLQQSESEHARYVRTTITVLITTNRTDGTPNAQGMHDIPLY